MAERILLVMIPMYPVCESRVFVQNSFAFHLHGQATNRVFIVQDAWICKTLGFECRIDRCSSGSLGAKAVFQETFGR